MFFNSVFFFYCSFVSLYLISMLFDDVDHGDGDLVCPRFLLPLLAAVAVVRLRCFFFRGCRM